MNVKISSWSRGISLFKKKISDVYDEEKRLNLQGQKAATEEP